jgi:hypothetical protein
MVLVTIPSVAVHLLLGLAAHIPSILDATWVGEEGPLKYSRIAPLYTELIPMILGLIRYLPAPGSGLMGSGGFAVIKWAGLILAFVTVWGMIRRAKKTVSPIGKWVDKLLGFVD